MIFVGFQVLFFKLKNPSVPVHKESVALLEFFSVILYPFWD